MNNRNYVFDYLRCIAVLFIVTCHYLLFGTIYEGIGRYLAGVGNMLFFMLSAVIYGYKLRVEKGAVIVSGVSKPFNVIRFLTKRIFRLGTTLWPFLFIIIILYIIFEVHFSWIDVIFNFLFLGFLCKLPGNAHLWFLTVMIACYIEYAFINMLQTSSRFYSLLYLILTLSIMICLELYGLPGNFMAVLGFFLFFVVNYNRIVHLINMMSAVSFIVILAINILFLYMSVDNIFEKSRIIHYLLSDICGCLLLLLFLKVLPNRSNRFILFISNISFEIYLVHHTLCSGPFFRISSLTNNHFINYLLFIIISIVLAWLLKLISQIMNKPISNILT